MIFFRAGSRSTSTTSRCWARQTIVPLTIVTHRCVRQRPLPVGIDELRTGLPPRPRRCRCGPGAALFQRLDRVLHAYAKRPVPGLRAAGRCARAATWILARQEADGGWGGIQPPWVYSLLALQLWATSLDSPAMAAGIAGPGRLPDPRADAARGPCAALEACQSPVWDTALALNGLLDAGVGPNDPLVHVRRHWLLAEEISVARRLGRAPPGARAGRLGVRVRERRLPGHR